MPKPMPARLADTSASTVRPTARAAAPGCRCTQSGALSATATASACSQGFRRDTIPASAAPIASVTAPTKNARIIGASTASPGPCIFSINGTSASCCMPGAVMWYASRWKIASAAEPMAPIASSTAPTRNARDPRACPRRPSASSGGAKHAAEISCKTVESQTASRWSATRSRICRVSVTPTPGISDHEIQKRTLAITSQPPPLRSAIVVPRLPGARHGSSRAPLSRARPVFAHGPRRRSGVSAGRGSASGSAGRVRVGVAVGRGARVRVAVGRTGGSVGRAADGRPVGRGRTHRHAVVVGRAWAAGAATAPGSASRGRGCASASAWPTGVTTTSPSAMLSSSCTQPAHGDVQARAAARRSGADDRRSSRSTVRSSRTVKTRRPDSKRLTTKSRAAAQSTPSMRPRKLTARRAGRASPLVPSSTTSARSSVPPAGTCTSTCTESPSAGPLEDERHRARRTRRSR